MTEPRGRPVHPALVVLAVVGCLHLFFIIGVELDRNLVHRRDVARLEAEVSALTAELNRLDEVASRAGDSAYREALARSQGYVYPDEDLVVTAEPDR
ncbi:MAG TPA: hypothetical protein VFF10_07780 [Trueperaceae bacterium]|nr:hypothetical protein [Trueperaceae bacterium]